MAVILVEAWRANEHAIRQGLPNRFLVTAAEGFPSHTAELVEVANGESVARYQAKLRLNLKSASRYLADPRYEGMALLTTRESHARVVSDLTKREMSALRRGVPLAPQFERVRAAIASGRLLNRFGGRALPTFCDVEELTRQNTKMQFARRPYLDSVIVAKARYTGIARAIGRTVVAGDVLLVAYFQYQDTRRFREGAIQGDMYTARSALRGA